MNREDKVLPGDPGDGPAGALNILRYLMGASLAQACQEKIPAQSF
jgi:hypothetical protein